MVRVTVLGSGDAYCSGGRAHSAYLIEAPGSTFLVDCGATVLQSLKRAGRDPNDIDFVILSHLHGDHFGGIPYLVIQQHFAGRTRPLVVAGPPELAARSRATEQGLYPDFFGKTKLGFELRIAAPAAFRPAPAWKIW